MVELQVINKIIAENDFKPLTKYGIEAAHFTAYRDEFNFIMAHHGEHGKAPDPETILDKFPDFDLIEVGENYNYLADKLMEQFTFNQLVPVVKKVGELAKNDAGDAVEYMKSKVEELARINLKKSMGKDIISESKDRLDEYLSRIDREGLLGIPTGLEALDHDLFGWLPGEELAVILGRTNEGKSWVLLYFLVAAWRAGKTVLMYSGEMSANIVGYRFDTLNQHFSNLSLMSARKEVKDDYTNYINDLTGAKFIVITPRDLGGKRLDVKKLDSLIDIYTPDIVGLDQLSLMEDYRAQPGEVNRIKLNHIAEDLFQLTEDKRIPILTPSQANRDTVKGKKSKEDEETPEAHNIAESDGIAQNATRIIALKQVPAGLKLSIRKNRYGVNNKEYIYLWDIDRGVIADLPIATQSDSEIEDREGVDLF